MDSCVCGVQAPEMVRVPLEELVLQIHLLGLGPAGQFLEKVLEPPPKASVEGALAHLQALGALTPQHQLTPLGLPVAACKLCLHASYFEILLALLGLPTLFCDSGVGSCADLDAVILHHQHIVFGGAVLPHQQNEASQLASERALGLWVLAHADAVDCLASSSWIMTQIPPTMPADG